MNEAQLVLFGVILCIAVAITARYLGYAATASVCGLFMCLVPATGGVPIDFFGLTNFGNLLYAPVIVGTVLTRRRFGHDKAFRQVWIVFSMLLLRLGILTIVVNTHKGSVVDALRLLTDWSIRLTSASFFAYVFANVVAINFASRPWLALLAAQTVDSICFFPIAFIGTEFPIVQAMISGWLCKCAISACALPLFKLFPFQTDSRAEHASQQIAT